jgi:hypothetical protein
VNERTDIGWDNLKLEAGNIGIQGGFRTMQRRSTLSWIALALATTGCLPGDTRPVPGSVYLTAEPSEATTRGFTTQDGWHVTFERFLIGMGDVSLEGDACNSYSNANYERLFAFTAGGRQKVGIVYGLGSCGLQFRVRSPSSDALLGAGVTGDELAFMRTTGTDAYAEEQRVGVYVRGRAARGDVTKRFEWAFRKRYSLHDCKAGPDGGTSSSLELHGNDALALPLIVHGEELFRTNPDDAAPFQFDLMASADADGDGAVTLDEMAKIPAPPPEMDGGVGPGTGGFDAGADAGDAGGPTLADLVYLTLVPRAVRLGTSAACVADERSRGGG